MSADSLYKELLNLPTELSSFEQFQCIKLEEDFDTDSLGSCCSSPTQSNTSDCSSPTQTSECSSSASPGKSDNEFFTFPMSYEHASRLKSTKPKKATKTENKVKRNERERRRVRRLADGFKRLRSVVPGNAKKLSKLQTLQTAVDYMVQLCEVIATEDSRVLGNQLSNCHTMLDSQIYPSEFAYYQDTQPINTQVLSHPPVQWTYADVQAQQSYSIMESTLSPTMQHQNPVWYMA